jgi:hypothetical protein
MASRKRKDKPIEAATREDRTTPHISRVLLLRLSDPKNFKWIALVVIVGLIPVNDRKEVFLSLQNHYLIITILIAVIAIMAIMWYYTHKDDSREIERLVWERDKLQEKLGCSVQSSEETQL